ncbi:MAG TPA: DNA repair exonuclease [Aminobacteriaceae bacterium]|nr:DNA repair exonuclease [Aminobacteriaceae bacterium]
MVRFVHTADWQIGMKLAKIGDAGKRVREERFSAARRVIDAASAHGAEFILVAGDLFEDNAVDRTQVRMVADILGKAPCPVFIIPGNHDPLVPGAVWEDRSWEAARNVVVFSENAPYELPGATLYPCPLRGKQSDADPTSWIRAEGGDRIHIGLAHGSVEGAPIGEWDHPIPRDAASRSGLDYLALGHWHSFGLFGTKDAPRTAYSGTHEPTSFGERDSGNALIVDIEAPGCAPVLTPVRTGGISWISIEEQIDSRDALESVRERIGTLQNPERTLLRVRLSGLMRPDDRDALEEIALAAASFLWSEVDESGLLPSPEDDSWIGNLPAGLLREVGKRLNQAQEAPEIRTKALLELYALLSEVKA